MKLKIIVPAILIIALIVVGSLFIAGEANWVMYLFYHPDKVDNPEAATVTQEELEDFLADYEITVLPGYDCNEFSLDLHNAAEAQGIETAIVIVRIGVGDYHAFNAFLLVSGEIVYADATVGQSAGIVGEVVGVDGVLTSRAEWDSHVTTQRLGYEKDFLFFW